MLLLYYTVLKQPPQYSYSTLLYRHSLPIAPVVLIFTRKPLECSLNTILYYNSRPSAPVIVFISSQSLNLGGCRGTTDAVATIPFHPSLSSAALRESPNPIPFHSLMLSSHLFFCLPLLLAPFTVPCRIVFAMPEDLEMWPYHMSFRFFTMVRRS